ncbi:MAG TPA: GAF domain-containing protein [Candidatus Limnocylindrales bacterium]|nr:GAF domain-containing protein [Candidatus Limnocylindrales bacterium]
MTGAAHILGVHPNTVRTWTELGRLPCLRINDRGDRRYRVEDLAAFMTAAEQAPPVPRPGRPWQASAGDAAGLEPDPAERRARPHPERDADRGRRAVELHVLAEISRLTGNVVDLDATFRAVVHLLRAAFGYRVVIVGQLRDGAIEPRVAEGIDLSALYPLPIERGLIGAAAREARPIFAPDVRLDGRYVEAVPGIVSEIVAPIIIGEAVWGVLWVEDDRAGALEAADVEFIETVANQLAVAADNLRLVERVRYQLHQADALRRISADISSKLELSVLLSDLVDHGMRLFGADRGAVFHRAADGSFVADVARGLSPAFLEATRQPAPRSLEAESLARRGARFAVAYAQDARAGAAREAVLAEGIDTVAAAPLLAGDEQLGVLTLYHDRRHDWESSELDALDALAVQASIAIANARDYAQMSRWTAHIESIQKLGARLSRLATVREIGLAIAAELNQLIDYHNVRVYRVRGDDLDPVAWRGEIGEYTDEVEEQLRLKVGEGITGWVAREGQAVYLPDAANDPRAATIAGTEEDLPESMLLAPMAYEDRTIGVIVLSKLGLHQFSPDDLRLLEIYASFAAQAMANADTTEQLRAQSDRLERQLRGQRELLQVTESLLGTLDTQAVVEEIGDRLGALVRVDNLGVDLYEPESGILRPLTARGVHRELYMSGPISDTVGVAGWVIRHGEAQLINDELADPRVREFGELGPVAGALIVAPLRSRDGIAGVLTLERLGHEASFTEDEFELVKLFAAQASIALQNARAHQAVERRARRDALTELGNQGSFQEALAAAVARAEPFSLVLLDLDDFKGYNDSLGHAAGNALLHRIARALETAGRGGDATFRYGGDEFALLLPGTDGPGALAVAEKVRQAVRSASRAPGSRRVVGCSIGVASFPTDGDDAEALALAADRALYVAKRGGRDRVATAQEGLALAAEFLPTGPTPVDEALEPERP